jgi:ATP-dependent DNA helicase RecG
VTTFAALQSLIAQGESETLELKRSTAELKRAGETLCAFLNGEGGKVLIGASPDGRVRDAPTPYFRGVADDGRVVV